MPTVIVKRSAGWDKLQKRLERYQRDFALDFGENDVKDVAQNHLAYAKVLCPVDKGDLRESLHLTMDQHVYQQTFKSSYIDGTKVRGSAFVSGDKSSEGAVSVASRQFATSIVDSSGRFIKARYYLTTRDPIARFVEYGTSKMTARPFMRPALDFAWAMFRARARRYIYTRVY